MDGISFPAIGRIQDGILKRQKEDALTQEDIQLMKELSEIFRMLDEYYQLKEIYEEEQ